MERKTGVTVEWFIIFTGARYKKGIMKWLRKDMSHVYAMKKSEGGQFWMVVNPFISHVSVDLILVDDYPHPGAYAGNSAYIIPVTAHISGEPKWAFCVFNCVEVIKGLLGIKSFWTWTPYQLYKYLKRK